MLSFDNTKMRGRPAPQVEFLICGKWKLINGSGYRSSTGSNR